MAIEIITKAAPETTGAPAAAAAPPPKPAPPPAPPKPDTPPPAEGEPGEAARADVDIDPKTLARLTTLSKSERDARAKVKAQDAELVAAKARIAELEALAPKAQKLDEVSKLMETDPIGAFRLLEKDLDAAMAAFIATPPKSEAEKAAAAEVGKVQAKLDEIEKRLGEKEKAEGETKTKAEQDAAAAKEAAALEGIKGYTAEKLKTDEARWELTGRRAAKDATVVPEIIEAAKRMAIDQRKELGRALTDEESDALLEKAIDTAEEHFAELGADLQRSTPREVRPSAKRRELETLRPAETERHPSTIDGTLRGPLRGNPAPRQAMTAAEAKARALAKYGGRRA